MEVELRRGKQLIKNEHLLEAVEGKVSEAERELGSKPRHDQTLSGLVQIRSLNGELARATSCSQVKEVMSPTHWRLPPRPHDSPWKKATRS